jgi:hypothetical protein
MTKKAPSRNHEQARSAHDERTRLVREQTEKESAANDAKTARLKALRLAAEAEAPPPPEPVKPKVKKKKAVVRRA